MYVEERHLNGRVGLSYRLSARDPALKLNMRAFGPRYFRLDHRRWLKDLFSDLEDNARAARGSERLAAARENTLERRGLSLFEELFPDDLQQVFWDIEQRIDTFLIQSNESWVPWELCVLQSRDANGRITEGTFFCHAFAMTRWFTGKAFCHQLAMGNNAVSGRKTLALTEAGREIDTVTRLLDEHGAVHEIEDSAEALVKAMAAGIYDGWHLVGHGAQQKGNDEVCVEIGLTDTLTPDGITGTTRNMALTNPFVFFNCCHAGRGGLTLTDVGGWAHRLVSNGAGAFIGPQWAVEETRARQFAEAFYAAFLGGAPLGAAGRMARAAVDRMGDGTRLAYAVFGHPMARFQPKDPHPITREDFGMTITEGSRGFVGRAALFESLDRFTAAHDRGYWILEAPSGFGKTAFLAALARTRTSIAYFNCGLEDITSREQLWRNIGYRCVKRYDLDTTARNGDDLLTWLARTRGDMQHLFIIDALDEADQPETGNTLGLPEDLPHGVHVVVAARPGRYTLTARCPSRRVVLDATNEDQHQTMRLVTDALAESPGEAALLREAANGSPLSARLARFLVRLDGDLDPLPIGLDGLFEAVWNHLTRQSSWNGARDVLAVLTVAREPLPIQLVARLMAVASVALDPVLNALSPLTHLREDDTIRLSHLVFRDLLTAKDGRDGFSLRAGHARFVRLLQPFTSRAEAAIG